MADARLSELLSRLLHAPPPFYRERLRAAGIASAADAGDEWLRRLPPTRREELVRDQVENLPLGSRRFADAAPPVRAGKTGTGQGLLVLAFSAADLARERAAGVRLLRRLGVEPGMRLANALPGALVTPGALLWGDVVEEIGALDVPLGAVENETTAKQVWDLLDLVEPDVLVVTAESGPGLFAAAPERERPWWKGILQLRVADARAVAALPPSHLEFRGWQRTWFAVPEATSFVASSCAVGRMHVDEEVVVERLENGSLLFTPFGLDTPILRYDAGVKGDVSTETCTCGESGVILHIDAWTDKDS